MRVNLVVLCFMTILVSDVFAKKRGLLSGSGLVHKPTIDGVIPIGPGDDNQDGCTRQYPLTPKNAQQVPYAFKRYSVVPDLLAEPPADLLEVEFNAIDHCQPNLGNNVDVCGLLSAPSLLRWKCSSGKLYTIFFIDINPYGAAHPTLGSQGILWWVVDVPGCNVAAGTTIYAYQPPTPCYGAGTGRYAILAYEQPSFPIDWSEEHTVSSTSLKYRFYSCLDKLVNKYELKLIAGNLFISEYKPCLEPILAGLDHPYPQYLTRAIINADLPADPFTIAVQPADALDEDEDEEPEENRRDFTDESDENVDWEPRAHKVDQSQTSD